MIGNYIYAVVSQPAVDYNNTVVLPLICNGNSQKEIAPTSIYSRSVWCLPITLSQASTVSDVLDDSQQATNLTITTGDASSM